MRYTALTGYLRKKAVVTDGRAEFTLLHGESQRGWARHFFHLSLKQFAWFDEDPQRSMERQRTARRSLRARLREAAHSYVAEHSAGKGVGSAMLYTAPCRLYVSRLYRHEFALAFGDGKLLCMQAGSGADAQKWVVAIASCLFFSSAAFEAVLAECQRFFEACPKTVRHRLSAIEALDLVRSMGRDVRYSQVVQALADVGEPAPTGDGGGGGGGEGLIGWFGPREFTYLVRSVCQDADPRSELLRAFRLLDTTASDGGGGSQVSINDLTQTMRAVGVPEEHVLMVIRAAGADAGGESIPYTRLADALYPAAATAAKRRRMLLHGTTEEDDQREEERTRALWEQQREGLLLEPHAPPAAPPDAARALQFHSNATDPSRSIASLTLSDGASNRSAGDAPALTPRREQIARSIRDQSGVASSMPATPRTIAGRVDRARRASMAAAQKATARFIGAGAPSSAGTPGGAPATATATHSGPRPAWAPHNPLSVPFGAPVRVPLPPADAIGASSGAATGVLLSGSQYRG